VRGVAQRRLGVEHIDLYYQHRHRVDPGVPSEDTVGTMVRLVDFDADDYRRTSPRFQGDNFARNLAWGSRCRRWPVTRINAISRPMLLPVSAALPLQSRPSIADALITHGKIPTPLKYLLQYPAILSPNGHLARFVLVLA